MSAPLILASLLLPGLAPEPDLPPGLLVYEPFDLDPGQPLLGSAGGAGWVGPWRPTDYAFKGPDVRLFPKRYDHLFGMADSLALPGLAHAGGSASAVASAPQMGIVCRRLAVPFGRRGTTAYVGVRLKPEGRLHAGNGHGFFALTLEWRDKSGRLSGGHVGLGKPWANPREGLPPIAAEWCLLSASAIPQVLRAGGRAVTGPLTAGEKERWADPHAYGRRSGTYSTGVPVVPGATTLLVLKGEFAPVTGQRFGLLVNPDPAAADPVPPAVIQIPLGVGADWHNNFGEGYTVWLTLLSTGAVTVDEIRVATTLAGAAGRGMLEEMRAAEGPAGTVPASNPAASESSRTAGSAGPWAPVPAARPLRTTTAGPPDRLITRSGTS